MNNKIILNKLNYYDSDFQKFKSGCSSCLPNVYVSKDPRLISSAHDGQQLLLDSIPLNGKIMPWNTPYISPTHYMYNNYSDINNGQTIYYYSKDLATPFIPQVFTQPQIFQKQYYIDPMDSYKPHYFRIKNCDSKGCLTWIKDSEFHREDLMSKQQWNKNQNNYQLNLETNLGVV